jgi:CheY-like chemotaxis protein
MAAAVMPDLILLDLSLPEMDGWEVLRQLKQDARMKKIPVVALTAHALVTDRLRALEAGFNEYDIKPVEMPRLLKKMDTLLGVSATESVSTAPRSLTTKSRAKF